jgi:predicted GIY-YIG superfamily endonuclease
MNVPLPWCVYVLRSAQDGCLYIGFTADLPRRLEEHARGDSPATAPRRPLILLYAELHLGKADALRREAYFKTNAGKRKARWREAIRTRTILPRGVRRVASIASVSRARAGHGRCCGESAEKKAGPSVHVALVRRGSNRGMARLMNSSNKGTVNAMSPCAGL